MLKVTPFVRGSRTEPAGNTLLFADYCIVLGFLFRAEVIFSTVTVKPAAITAAPLDVNPPHTRVVDYLKLFATMKAASCVCGVWFTSGRGFSIQPIMFVVIVAGGVVFGRGLPRAHSLGSSVRRRLFSGAVGTARPRASHQGHAQ